MAIGAQNVFVLRQGLTRRHVGGVVAVCALSDLVLIAAGVAGVGALVQHAGWVLDVVRWAGVAFLAGYGLRSLWQARRPSALRADGPGTGARGEAGAGRTIGAAVALSWLNPHVYLDTVLLLGSVAATHGSSGRWWFAAGAGVASIVWFTALGYGTRPLAPVLARPAAWRVLDVVIGLTMLAIAVSLAIQG